MTKFPLGERLPFLTIAKTVFWVCIFVAPTSSVSPVAGHLERALESSSTKRVEANWRKNFVAQQKRFNISVVYRTMSMDCTLPGQKYLQNQWQCRRRTWIKDQTTLSILATLNSSKLPAEVEKHLHIFYRVLAQILQVIRFFTKYFWSQVVVSLGIFIVLLLGAGLCFPWSVQNLFETLTTIRRTEVGYLLLIYRWLALLDPFTRWRRRKLGRPDYLCLHQFFLHLIFNRKWESNWRQKCFEIWLFLFLLMFYLLAIVCLSVFL